MGRILCWCILEFVFAMADLNSLLVLHCLDFKLFFTVLGTKQSIVKGVSHCFLPNCNKVTWPFMNYCGKTHADQGKKLGLKRECII